MPLDRFGLVKTSLLDFPGLVSAIVFTPGCNLRCPWCHNPAMVVPPYPADLETRSAVLDFLKKRKPVLQGLVVTGGEPLVHPDLENFLEEVKALGYAVKLDTNGTYPDRLAALRPGLVDYLALDLKAAPASYGRLTGTMVDPGLLTQTLQILRSQYPGRCELRLTWVPSLHDEKDLAAYAAFAGPGIPLFVTGFRPGETVDPAVGLERGATPAEVEAVVQKLVELGLDARVR